MASTETCYHCQQPMPADTETFIANIEPPQKVCCTGCKAVTEHIHGSGLASYYQFRTEAAEKPEFEGDNSDFAIYDDATYLNMVAQDLGANKMKIVLSVENIHCAACAWLIEQSLMTLPGVSKVTVNTVTDRAEVEWQPEQQTLSNVLSHLTTIGYPSAPFSVSDTEEILKKQNKQFVKRLGVAGLFTMQVMMLAIAMYFGAFSNMESHQKGYFKWISMLLSVPVVFYSAIPFLQGAFASLRARRLNMDVPVSIAIFGAFIASFVQLVTYGLDGDEGEVFFESISMFTFLLLIGKYLEFKAKAKALLSNANLQKTLPLVVMMKEGEELTTRLLTEIKPGDVIVIKPGETIAVDGTIVAGSSSINESVLNGEFEPIIKVSGDTVLAGSINNEGSIEVRVEAVGANTTLAHIDQLQSEFSQTRPKFSVIADKIAHWFVFAQLVIATGTYWYWHIHSPADALWISLSVLVATCPCALSLATPTAYTCVISTLNKKGILVKTSTAFDRLNEVDTVAFDKTGTLTEGHFGVIESHYYHTRNAAIDEAIVKLQTYSEHPIAKAFSYEALDVSPAHYQTFSLDEVNVVVGLGITATFNEQSFKIGSVQLIGDRAQIKTHHNVFVTIDDEVYASFLVSDQIKPDAKQLIEDLKLIGKDQYMLTGDSSPNVEETANKLGLSHFQKSLRPEQKAKFIQKLQSEGHVTLMVGDGINDAPVFSASDVSVAMGQGSDVTKYSSDIIILKNRLSAIADVLNSAQRTRQTIKQNLMWALMYNLAILPVAMMGLVPPYVAVVGMSASSIIVVTNSLKLLK